MRLKGGVNAHVNFMTTAAANATANKNVPNRGNLPVATFASPQVLTNDNRTVDPIENAHAIQPSDVYANTKIHDDMIKKIGKYLRVVNYNRKAVYQLLKKFSAICEKFVLLVSETFDVGLYNDLCSFLDDVASKDTPADPTHDSYSVRKVRAIIGEYYPQVELVLCIRDIHQKLIEDIDHDKSAIDELVEFDRTYVKPFVVDGMYVQEFFSLEMKKLEELLAIKKERDRKIEETLLFTDLSSPTKEKLTELFHISNEELRRRDLFLWEERGYRRFIHTFSLIQFSKEYREVKSLQKKIETYLREQNAERKRRINKTKGNTNRLTSNKLRTRKGNLV